MTGNVGWQVWNIFDNNVTAAQVQQAKANLRKAESAKLQQIETVKLEVHNAYVNLRIAEKNISIAQNAVKQADFIAQVRYEEGVDTNLTVYGRAGKTYSSQNKFLLRALYVQYKPRPTK